jgi:hypothetical protein
MYLSPDRCLSRVKADHLSVREAWADLPSLLVALPLPLNARKILGERLFARLNNLDEFVTTRTEVDTALGAKRMRVIFEPSPFFSDSLLHFEQRRWNFWRSSMR